MINKILLELAITTRWVGEKCLHCHSVFSSVENFIERNPKSDGFGNAVDAKCWNQFISIKGDIINIE